MIDARDFSMTPEGIIAGFYICVGASIGCYIDLTFEENYHLSGIYRYIVDTMFSFTMLSAAKHFDILPRFGIRKIHAAGLMLLGLFLFYTWSRLSNRIPLASNNDIFHIEGEGYYEQHF